MRFCAKDEVEYRGMQGVVTFADSAYIVISLPAVSDKNNPAGLVVFPEQQKNVYLIDSK